MPARWLAQDDEKLCPLLLRIDQEEAKSWLKMLKDIFTFTAEEARLLAGGFIISLAFDGSLYSDEVFKESLKKVGLLWKNLITLNFLYFRIWA